MDSGAIDTLNKRVATGLTWLSDNDPTGAFHFWFEAGLGPRSPLPAQDEPVREAWAAYHKARTLWAELDRRLAAVDPTWRDSPAREPAANGPVWQHRSPR